MTRKWGSCSTAGNVTLAADLAEQPTGFQDFVIVHELLHLRVPNHGKLFKALMTAYVPDWREHDLRRKVGNGNASRVGSRGGPMTEQVESAKPRLLSGGNPQIPKGDSDSPSTAWRAAAAFGQ